MATTDDPQKPLPHPEPPEARDEDYVVKAQMALSEFMLGHWHYFGYALVLVLVGSAAYGVWGSWAAERAEDQYGAIAEIDHRMPVVDQMAMFGMAPKDDPADVARTATLEEGARRYEALAASTSGDAAVVAWLKAEEAWMRAGKPESARSAGDKALATGGTSVIAFAADTSAVRALCDAGKTDEAEARLREMTDRYSGFFAEQSLIRLAGVQLDGEKTDAAMATYAELETRFPKSADRAALGALASRLGKPKPKVEPPAAPAGTP
ncbi:MAG: hypothetical protein EXR71_05275 [Myxococcales bacterium]|nr:hypothetical protein [Myxococcales bacterium]